MFPAKWNFFFGTPALRRIANRVAGFHPERTVPLLARQTFRAWFTRRVQKPRGGGSGGRRVFLFCDEFTDFFEPENGIAAVEVLEKLGYRVEIPRHVESGRAAISKGLLRRARKLARENVRLLASLVSEDSPLLGIEPSALLCFRDEYPLLLRGAEQLAARSLARNCLLLDEFFAREAAAGHLPKDAFCTGPGVIHLHPHCQQKALGSVRDTIRMLELIPGTTVRVIPSGCCGMAGAFGFEAEHFAFSQRVGELVLLPYVRGVSASEILCAPGTSCRHQISDGTGRQAEHPIRILRAALSC
jgi:Fe-S oxidoreductase